MYVQQRRELTVLEAVAEDERITQRSLANKLGVALGLTNLYLKRLVRKGYIKCVNVQSNRILYLITPQGISEKARLTYEFMEYSFHLYRLFRQRLNGVIQSCADAGQRQIAIYGTGEMAELAYLSLKEVGLEPAAVFGANGQTEFLGMTVRPISAHCEVEFDLLIVAMVDGKRAAVDLALVGVSPDRLITVDGMRSTRDGVGGMPAIEWQGAGADTPATVKTPRRGRAS
jgi:DNA-binding MarR family transcriptional regulator